MGTEDSKAETLELTVLLTDITEQSHGENRLMIK